MISAELTIERGESVKVYAGLADTDSVVLVWFDKDGILNVSLSDGQTDFIQITSRGLELLSVQAPHHSNPSVINYKK